MNESPPIACTLAPSGLRERRAAWQRLGDSVLHAGDDIPGGIRLTYAPEDAIEATLHELVKLERDCCAFADWTVERRPDAIVLTVSAESPEGAAAVRAILRDGD